MGSQAQTWTKLLERCLQDRIPAAQFEAFAKILDRTPISRAELARIVLEPRPGLKTFVDPLLPQYVEALVRIDLVGPDDLLDVLLRHSRLRQLDPHPGDDDAERTARNSTSPAPPSPPRRGSNPVPLDHAVLVAMAHLFHSGQRPRSPREVYMVLKAMAAWMSTVVAAGTTDDMMQSVTGHASHTSSESQAIVEAVGMFMYAIADNPRVLSVLGGQFPKDVKSTLTHALSLFIPVVFHSSPPIATRLEAFQRTNDLVPGRATKDDDKLMEDVDGNALGLDGLGGLGAVETAVIHSRAGLYIFLHSLLAGRPIIDDNMVLTHLTARYKGDISNLTTDLIVAAFDVLSNATFRNESQQTRFLLRAFLINKIPVLLTTLSLSMFPPLTPEFCIGQAMTHVDTQAFPTLSAMFDAPNDGGGAGGGSGSGFFSDVRQEFLFACCLHGLIPETSIETLLGEMPMQELPPGGKYTRELLVSQCASDPGRIEPLLGEVEGMDGNAGAVVEAIVEIIRNMCAAKGTIALKTICMTLAARPSSLDVMLCFASPAAILQPICELLDTWQYEEDQGEYQPVYEEFGCILLVVLAFVHRYDLTALDLGLADGTSFVAQLLRPADTTQRVDELSEDHSTQLAGWLRGLFEPDSGITDELMAACRPQVYYMLVPVLLSQSVLACHAGVISVETLKGGLEYMLETFLLPSLISALSWLSHHLWEEHGDIDVVMQILQIIVKPSSISGEAAVVHAVVLSLVGKQLECALRDLRRRKPDRSDVDVVLQHLQPHATLKRTTASHHSELESWTSHSPGGLLSSLRNTFQSLVLWSTAPDINMTPANYTHRHLLVAVRLLGARAVIQTILDEMKMQAQSDSGDLDLDIATSLVVAPTVDDVPIVFEPCLPATTGRVHGQTTAPPPPPPSSSSHQQRTLYRPKTRLSLRDALRLEHDDVAPKISTADPPRAENIIRLYRRVEAHFAGVVEANAAADVSAHALAGVPGGLAGVPGSLAGVAGDLDVSSVPTAADMIQGLEVAAATATAVAAAAAAGIDVDVDMNMNMDDVLMLGQAATAISGTDTRI